MNSPLLSTAYWPPVDWFALWTRSGSVRIEACESIQKQSYRNRCRILTSRGVQELIIPLDRQASKHIQEIKLSYQEDWQRVHWRAIEAAYSSTGFYHILRDDIHKIYNEWKPDTLWEWNMKTIQLCREWLQIADEPKFTAAFEKSDKLDFRQSLHPKKTHPLPPTAYTQLTFHSGKTDFVPHLSILDLLCNEGPAAYSILLGIE